MKIIESRFCFANRIGDKIVINKNLKKFPELYDNVINHEKSHVTNNLKEDVKIDMRHLRKMSLNQLRLRLIFSIIYPLSILQISPVWFYNKKMYFDITLILTWSVLFLIFSVYFALLILL